jgi:hypothetical protein
VARHVSLLVSVSLTVISSLFPNRPLSDRFALSVDPKEELPFITASLSDKTTLIPITELSPKLWLSSILTLADSIALFAKPDVPDSLSLLTTTALALIGELPVSTALLPKPELLVNKEVAL